jgi:hypothetical protein
MSASRQHCAVFRATLRRVSGVDIRQSRLVSSLALLSLALAAPPSRADPFAWTSPEHMPPAVFEDSDHPAIAVGPDGTVHMVWIDRSGTHNSGSDWDVFYRAYVPSLGWTDLGWSATRLISTTSTGDSFYPDVAVDSAGSVHIVWDDYTDYQGSGTDSDIFYRRYDRGSGWSDVEVISYGTTDSILSYPSIGVDPDGNAHVVWNHLSDLDASGQ